MHLVDASQDPLKEAVLSAIIGNTLIPETIIESMLNGMGIKMLWAHKYAKESYTLELPTGKTRELGFISNADLAPIIANDIVYPDGVLVSGNAYTVITPSLLILPYLSATRGYNLETNEIIYFPVGVVFEDVCVGTNEQGDCNSWNDADTYPQRMTITDISISENMLDAEVTYALWLLLTKTEDIDENTTRTYKQWTLNSNTYTETVPIPDVANVTFDEECVFAFYQKLDSYGIPIPEMLSWVYTLSDNTYPSLNIDTTEQPLDEFLPVVPLRYDNVDYTDVSKEDTDLYITSEILLKKLGLDFVYLGERINENPDVGDIDHAYVMFGVDVQSDFSNSMLYLNKFFSHLFDLQIEEQLDYFINLSNPDIFHPPKNSYVSAVGDISNFIEYGLNLTVKYSYITSTIIIGKIDNGRTGQSRKSMEPYTVMVPSSSGISYTGVDKLVPETRYKLVLETQESQNIIKRIVVTGLEVTNTIYGDHSVITTVGDVATDPDEHNLILPLQFNLAQDMKLPQRNALYADASLMVLNSYVKVKVKWYASSWFKAIIIIVAVVITIYTWGSTAKFWAALVAAVGSKVVAALIIAALFFTIQVTFKWIVKEIGSELGIIGAIILTIVAVVLSRGTSTITLLEFTMSTAQLMLQSAMALISATNDFLIEEGEAILNEYIDFSKKIEDRWEELKTAQELLEWKSDLDPLMFGRPARYKIVPSESPDAFYQRCLGLAGNTGFVIHDEIPNFISTRLTLDRSVSTDMYSMNSYI